MLASWPEYRDLIQKDKNKSIAVSQLHSTNDIASWLKAGADSRVLSLSDLNRVLYSNSENLICFPAYAQTSYIYDNYRIISVDEQKYQATPHLERLNQFDSLGASYNPKLNDIFIEFRLGKIVADAASELHSTIVETVHGKFPARLFVIDGLRTVDATYALAYANPHALTSRLLAYPTKSAHNKGMAVDLTLVGFDAQTDCHVDVDMHGHIDHPDMHSNHRNYEHISASQQNKRLFLECLMLKSTLRNRLIIAPLREEFWDFRFPEDGLDLWRVLESVARVTGCEGAHRICSDNIDHIHKLLRSNNKQQAYDEFELSKDTFIAQWKNLFADTHSKQKIADMLCFEEDMLVDVELVYHGKNAVIYDRDLPDNMKQTNPALSYLFE